MTEDQIQYSTQEMNQNPLPTLTPVPTLDAMIQKQIENTILPFDRISDPEKMNSAIRMMKEQLLETLFAGVSTYTFRNHIDKDEV